MSETAVGYVRLSQDGKSLNRQERDVERYAADNSLDVVEVYNEGKRASGFDSERPEYQKLLARITDDDKVSAVVVPNLSRLSRDRKERLRLLLDLDRAGVELHSFELGRPVDLDDDWELVQQSIQATTDDVEKRKEIDRSKRATAERLAEGYDHGRPPFGLRFDDAGEYWVPGDRFDDALDVIEARERGLSWREVATDTGVPKDTARRVYDRRERYLS
ncbi:recombinase family protein (plasmid) [Halarchaeum sp. CBA1220]|uniref:recombinase family protein n=1 Tax=Halarchaeum sp. CBA1220 TaxID=1853682 RepID=UPI0015A205EB|nr:recombinase family protein [Halarchaeum sp. CBA1220]QLC35766.1 recombinase family protein [Halarchaeum sp. CBA1220]